MGRAADAGARFRVRTPTVMWDEIGGEIVAINLSSGHYFSLRGAAVTSFRAFAHGASVHEVHTLLTDGATPAAVIEDDLATFVDELVDAGLVEAREPATGPATGGPDGVEPDAPGPAASDLAVPDAGATTTRYEAPRLETHTDLEDLMLLDPVHDVDGMGWPRARTDP